ncbi:uncharacterized protein BDZ99DRAFT_375600 [Mytilinidion resinicola]|uniref:RRM domain-containing protein n=1 Tax=Mytilinidion resinicola TaxID=574789 RepID=A0A6A6Z5J0_9PEZI|nr:uncharacterized protein BDZ99DRAFT_375600 [Mytilinidion resinicola]KAF2816366.1 hypothetical protein BDZ99DRAFT_375600 [Mytilinidion resinicola]
MDSQRRNIYANGSAAYKGPAMPTHYSAASQNHGAAGYLPRGVQGMAHHMADTNMSTLANGMGGMSLHSSFNSSAASKNGSQVSAASSEYGGVPLAHHQGLWIPNQHVLSGMYNVMPQGAQQQTGLPHSPGLYTPYMQQASYQYGHHAMAENSPMGPTWASRVSSGEMPALMTPRRDSISSNENDLPGTPYTGYGVYRNGATVMDRSPSGVFTHSATPSPSQMSHSYALAQMGKAQPLTTLPPHLMILLQQEPAIPRAIPAPQSPLKPLDRSLENKNGETNVYIRGLLPETTDEMLHAWGSRFGDIQSSKSIIDLKTNLCKGFGFIKYHNFADAEDCIRGFHYLGYEVSFARESFYAKLKKFADENNTNLYVSNIPRNMNEHELGSIFAPHKVCSSRILRDSSGNGRGVGFARFETREICEEIIRNFNNTPVSKPGGEEHLIQIRYSDTHEQKLLKQQTAAGRQFRAAEYDMGVAVARQTMFPTEQRFSHLSATEQDAANEFEVFLQAQQNQHPQSYAPQPPRVRAWVPPVTSNLGMQRSTMHPMSQSSVPSIVKVEGDGSSSDHDGDAKTTPATPVKASAEDASSSSHGSTRHD